MKIAVVDNLPEGGAKRVVFEQIKYLSQRHQVFYYTNQIQSSFKFDKYVAQKKSFNFDFPLKKSLLRPSSEFKKFYQLRKTYQQVAAEINHLGPDLVLVHPDQQTQAPWILKFLQAPSLYFIEETLRIFYEPKSFPLPEVVFYKRWYEQRRRFLLSFLDRRNLGAATRLMTSSFFMKRQLKKAYPRQVLNSKIRVNHLGVDLSLFQPPSKKNHQPKHFLFIGQKEAINGYPLLQAALKKLETKIPIKYVTFAENKFALSNADLVKLYRASFATLCLAQDEPFGLTALEAMACQVPVIAINEGGYQETVVNQETGLLIPTSSTALAQAMQTLLTQPKLRQKLGRAGRKRVETLFTWERHGKVLEKELLLLSNN